MKSRLSHVYNPYVNLLYNTRLLPNLFQCNKFYLKKQLCFGLTLSCVFICYAQNQFRSIYILLKTAQQTDKWNNDTFVNKYTIFMEQLCTETLSKLGNLEIYQSIYIVSWCIKLIIYGIILLLCSLLYAYARSTTIIFGHCMDLCIIHKYEYYYSSSIRVA